MFPDLRRRYDAGDSDVEERQTSAGEFAAYFARKSRPSLQVLLPQRRVWLSLGAITAAAALVSLAVMVVPGGGKTPASAHQGARSVSEATRQGDDVQQPPAKSSSPSPSPPSKPSTVFQPPAKQAPAPAPAPKQPAPPSNFLSASGHLSPANSKYWGANDLNVVTAVPLSALRLTVRVVQTGGVGNTGCWTTFGNKANVSVTSDSSAVTYVVTLKPGVTLPAGSYGIGAQFGHWGNNRSFQQDTYEVTGTAVGTGSSREVRGHF